MIRSNVVGKVLGEGQRTGMDGLDEAAVLAAVLAAALVEYGSQLEQQSASCGPQDAQDAWRMLACLDRLQGRA